MENTEVLTKYRSYFEAWLDIRLEQMLQARGIMLCSHEKRRYKPEGGMLYLPVCAFETDDALFISCIPEWENELSDLLMGATASDATTKMNTYLSEKECNVCELHRLYGLESLDMQIDSSRAVALDITHYEKYLAFYNEKSPAIAALTNPHEWMEQDYKERIERNILYGILEDEKIVSVTDSETIPSKPEKMMRIGIDTLPLYRRKGYASMACAAFIENHLRQGSMPVWECGVNNIASQNLAEKLGFRYLGNIFYAATLDMSLLLQEMDKNDVLIGDCVIGDEKLVCVRQNSTD